MVLWRQNLRLVTVSAAKNWLKKFTFSAAKKTAKNLLKRKKTQKLYKVSCKQFTLNKFRYSPVSYLFAFNQFDCKFIARLVLGL